MDETTGSKILWNYQNVCRTCLSETDELLSIFCNSKSQNKTYAEMVMACTSLQILQTDEVSLRICTICINQIEQLYLFYLKCQESDLVLQFSYKFCKQYQNELNNLKNNIKQSNTADPVSYQTNQTINEEIKCDNYEEGIEDNSNGLIASKLDCATLSTCILISITDQTDELIKEEVKCDDFEERIAEECNESNNDLPERDFDSAPLSPDILISPDDQTEEFINKDVHSLQFEEGVAAKSNRNNNGLSANDFDCAALSPDFLISASDQTEELTNKDVDSDDFEERLANEINKSNNGLSANKFDCARQEDVSTKKQINQKLENKSTSSLNKNEENKMVQCKFCLKTYISELSLEKHMETHLNQHYECDECNCKLSSSERLRKHKKAHRDGKMCVCNICNLNLLSIQHLNVHKVMHLNKPKFICNECGQVLACKNGFKKHKLTHDESNIHKCEICGVKLNKRSLTKHMLLHNTKENLENKDMDENENNKIVQCKYCLKSYISELSLDKHIETHSNDTHECNECGLRFQISLALFMHKKVHLDGKKEHVCNICNLNFATSHHLNLHKVMHLINPKFICDECGQVLLSKTSINTHKSIHDGNTKCICEICGVELNKRSMTKHMLLHNIGEIETVAPPLDETKIVQCKCCLKTWTSELFLEKHMKIHVKQTYDCNECGLKLSSSISFSSHKKIHLDGKLYACNICNLNFPTTRHLTLHKIIHQKKFKFFCGKCGRVLSSKSSWRFHKSAHDGTIKRNCKMCGLVVSANNMLRHMARHKNIKPHICDKCGRGFIQKPEFRYHRMICNGRRVIQTHSRTKSHTEIKSYKCSMCSKAYTTRQCLWLHSRLKHQSGLKEDSVRKYDCTKCKRRFYSKHLFDRHIRAHVSTLQTLCKICNMNFETYGKLQEHRRSEHKLVSDKTCQCQICGKFLATPYTLELHMLVHTNARPHKCSFCDKRFNQTAHKYSHERLHTGEKPYTCVQCNKSFRHQTTLVEHNRQHTGETPYKCIICDKGFYRTGNLKKHLNSHK